MNRIFVHSSVSLPTAKRIEVLNVIGRMENGDIYLGSQWTREQLERLREMRRR